MLWFPAGPCVSPFTVPTHLTVLGSASARDKDIYSLIINILFLKKPSHSYVLLKKFFSASSVLLSGVEKNTLLNVREGFARLCPPQNTLTLLYTI